MASYEFARPDRFVAGTVGPPGQRTFFLQAREGRVLASVSLEKQQVGLLADRINDLLDDFASAAGPEGDSAVQAVDNDPLDTPIEDEFRVMTIALSWDPDGHQVVIECDDAADQADDPGEAADDVGTAGRVGEAGTGGSGAVPGGAEPPAAPDVNRFRVWLTPAAAREFARRAGALVAAGRPPCPFCGGPLDPSGHVCPRSNGYKR